MSSTRLIMVVDDDPQIRDALKDALEDEAYSVVLATNGEEALRKLRNGCHPDAILLDHMMPIMDGATFVTEAHAEPALRELPIILVTADGRATDKANELGLKASLHKPLKIGELLATIENAIAH